eukprot:gene25569-30873_t
MSMNEKHDPTQPIVLNTTQVVVIAASVVYSIIFSLLLIFGGLGPATSFLIGTQSAIAAFFQGAQSAIAAFFRGVEVVLSSFVTLWADSLVKLNETAGAFYLQSRGALLTAALEGLGNTFNGLQLISQSSPSGLMKYSPLQGFCIFSPTKKAFAMQSGDMKEPNGVSKSVLDDSGDGDGLVDLWIVGAGTLGELVAKQYKQQYPEARIVAETSSTTRHATYAEMGVTPRLRSARSARDDGSARHVLICIPPSQSEDYGAEVARGCRLWHGATPSGLLFTSSVAVYGEADRKAVGEDTPLPSPPPPRSLPLLQAEGEALRSGGRVLRLAGLYSARRGPHTFWLKRAAEGRAVDGGARGFVNLIHYEDAAALCVRILEHEGSLEDRVFVGVDAASPPMTRAEICAAALASPHFRGAAAPQFSADAGAVGKIVVGDRTKRALRWAPRHASFAAFMRGEG